MSLLPRVLGRVGSFVHRLRALRRTRGITDPDRLLEFFEQPSPGWIFKPSQKRAEIRELFCRVSALRPRRALEIGTNNGGSLFMFCRAAASDATLVSIDLPGGRFGGGYPVIRVPYYLAFAGARQRVRLIRADSHTPVALAAARRAARGGWFDFLFIDGDHSYAGVKQDFEMYGPLVRPGGLIAFHDILPAPPELGGGVPQFWSDIRERYPTEELVEDRTQGMMGIGLVHVPELGISPTVV